MKSGRERGLGEAKALAYGSRKGRGEFGIGPDRRRVRIGVGRMPRGAVPRGLRVNTLIVFPRSSP